MATHSTLGSLFSDIADAIRAKTGGSATIVADTFPTAISNIPTATGDAVVGNVLSGKTFSNSTSVGLTGTMTNNGAVSGTISTKAGTYTVPSGYHNGSGSVAISSTEQAKIIASNIKKNISILGVTGTYEGFVPSGNINITDTNSTNVYNYATAQVVDSNLVAGNIKKNTVILGITGTYEGSGGHSTYAETTNTYGITATITN